MSTFNINTASDGYLKVVFCTPYLPVYMSQVFRTCNMHNATSGIFAHPLFPVTTAIATFEHRAFTQL